ncbi:hypothetical protein IQ26_07347 [Mesorhizobium tianshanense]|uniref:Uncharacterized protein n=1 Tax=Mesorhizobium tianshanense TaxID=39844 RepID=A0A562MFD0_9HYPH|nr:hypothetical protein IQ26_07347 [Mesorhizobium tianshanense]
MSSLRTHFDRLLEGAAPKVTRQELTHIERLALVRRHGDFSLAYSTAVQRNLSYFGDADRLHRHRHQDEAAFRARRSGGSPARQARPHQELRRKCRRPLVRATARVLAELGYRVNRLGVEMRLLLPAHDFSGKRNETVRYSERWLLKKDSPLPRTSAPSFSTRSGGSRRIGGPTASPSDGR